MNNTETEIRFFFPSAEYDRLYKQILDAGGEFVGRFHELTVMYDNPNPEYSFYNPEVDGRLRVRTSKLALKDNQALESSGTPVDSAKITWKRRLKAANKNNIHTEEEIEARLDPSDSDNLIAIFENVMHCPRKSSYERYRTKFRLEGLSITIDEFPYGIMFEIELTDNGTIEQIEHLVKRIGLKQEDAYALSCDDKYVELCEENQIHPKDDILFTDAEMPKIGE